MGDADPYFARRLLVTLRRRADGAYGIEHVAAALEHRLSGLGEGNGAAGSIAEGDAEGGLEALHPSRHRGLGQVERAGGAAHRARFRDGHEGPDVVEFHFGILTMRTIHVQHAEDVGMLPGMPTPPPSIVRSWSARATTTGADAYLAHFQHAVLPALRRVTGHRGALVLRRRGDHGVEITVLSLWESMAAIHEFAGADATVAVIEPEARAILQTFDARAEHFELALYAEP